MYSEDKLLVEGFMGVWYLRDLDWMCVYITIAIRITTSW